MIGVVDHFDRFSNVVLEVDTAKVKVKNTGTRSTASFESERVRSADTYP
jgi:hypothetical protein